jgi:hypothetical protein
MFMLIGYVFASRKNKLTGRPESRTRSSEEYAFIIPKYNVFQPSVVRPIHVRRIWSRIQMLLVFLIVTQLRVGLTTEVKTA